MELTITVNDDIITQDNANFFADKLKVAVKDTMAKSVSELIARQEAQQKMAAVVFDIDTVMKAKAICVTDKETHCFHVLRNDGVNLKKPSYRLESIQHYTFLHCQTVNVGDIVLVDSCGPNKRGIVVSNSQNFSHVPHKKIIAVDTHRIDVESVAKMRFPYLLDQHLLDGYYAVFGALEDTNINSERIKDFLTILHR